MNFNDEFKNHILADKVHMLNVAFLVPDLRREFGGCAGNIAYNLNLLGGAGYPMGTVGEDFAPYANWLTGCGISQDFLMEIPNAYTAQAFITTDMAANQITAFHPGAMNHAHKQAVVKQLPNGESVSIGMVSPDGRDAMLQHATQFVEQDIPWVFDPGQGLPMFDGAELKVFIEQATWVIVNDYESQMLMERTGLSLTEIAAQVEALIVTKGAAGSVVYTAGEALHIPVVSVTATVDPTGCGDAYRGGLLYGLMAELEWPTIGRIASLMGGLKIEKSGTQNHSFTQQEFAERFTHAWGYEL